MADTLCTEQNCIVEFLVLGADTFSSMESKLKLGSFFLCSKQKIQVFVQGWVSFLFADHIKGNDSVVIISFCDSIKLLLNVFSTQDFQTTNNEFDLHHMEALFKLIFNFFENLHFFFDGDHLTIIVKNFAKNVNVFNYCASFTKVCSSHVVYYLFKKWFKVVQGITHEEFRLKFFPSVLRFKLFKISDHFIFKILIKSCGATPILS